MSRRPLRLGIRTRELLAFSVLTLAIVTVTTLIHLAVVTHLTLDQVEQESRLLAEQVLALARNRVAEAPDASPAAALAGSDALQTLLDAHVGFSRYAVYVAITDHDGREIATNGSDEGARPEKRPPALEELTGSGWFRRLRSLLFGDRPVYEARLPLDLDGAPFGTIHVGVATGLIEDQLERSLGRALWISLGALLLSWLIALGIAQLTLRPIRLIRQRIGRLRGGGRAEDEEEVKLGRDFEDLAAELRLFGQEVKAERLHLFAHKASLEQLAQHLQDGVLVLNAEGEILFVNDAFAPVLGVAPDDAFGRPLAQILPDHDLTRAVEQVAAEHREIVGLQVICPVDRGEKHFLTSIHPVDDPDGVEAGFVILAEDLEPIHVVRTLVRYGAQMTAVKRLAGWLVHEIKNPLNAMNLHVEILRHHVAGESEMGAGKSLAVISSEIARLDRLLEEYRRLASPENLRLSPLDLHGLVGRVGDLIAPEARQSGVQLRTELAKEAMEIDGDEERLTQAFLNIVRNAIEAMSGGGELTIRTAGGSSLLCEIEFLDTGPGIPPDQIDRIFELYHTTKESGSGMGLFLVHRIVQQHGGIITAASGEDRGTCFTIRLPRRDVLSFGDDEPEEGRE